MSKQETYEIIEAYLNGTLTGTDLADFEARLQTDSDLAAQVALFREMDDAVSDKAVLNFQDLVRSEGTAFLENTAPEKQTEPTVAKRVSLSRRYLAIAASLLVLIVSALIFWMIQSGTPPSGPELFAQHFETYDLNQSVRSNDTSIDAVFESGIQQYQAEDYTNAAKTFEQLATAKNQDMILAFCLGSTYLNQQTPQFDLAQQQFQKIIDEGQSIYVPRAKWYLALILLQKGDMEQAKDLLEEVAKSRDGFGMKAKKVLEEI